MSALLYHNDNLRNGYSVYFVPTGDQVESPYSPPDSDGTPLGSPNEQRILPNAADCSLFLPDIEGKSHTPINHVLETECVTKSSSASPVRLDWF